MGLLTLIGIGLLSLWVVYAQVPWETPYFLSMNTPGVEIGEITNYMQIIKMDEELPLPIKLAKLNYRGLTPRPEIESFQLGTNKLLNASINRDQRGWFIEVNARQDYENPSQQRYEFLVTVGNQRVSVYLLLQNIFDENPSITYNGPCIAEELQSNFNTKCVFLVNDPDGMQGNKIRLEIEGNNGEADLFEFKDAIIVDTYQMEFTLYVKKELRYEQRALYSFRTYAYDIANNNGSIATIVEVQDMPSMDPIWVTPFATATFKEKSEQTFQVRAVDGDTGIDKKINYKLIFDEGDYSEFISIDKESGTLQISPIDRDTLNQEVFTFSIYAYKFDNETWGIQSTAVVIVEDINDHLPEIEISPNFVAFREETYLTVPLTRFSVNDLDLGVHATYNVTLSQNGDILYSEAFDVIPNNGYKEANFKLSVVNAPLLDYENEIWRELVLVITAQETNFPANRTQLTLPIKLINWNDEVPIFEKDVYNVNLLETVGAEYIIAQVEATDADIDDRVIHEIVGGLANISISEDGVLTTTADDIFDYERQTEVIIQIKATDTLQVDPEDKLNTAFTQLNINVVDVNDETPEIRMPRSSPNITENSPGNVLITSMIVATDPDTTADLYFEINWNDTYATKSGQDAPKDTYENCFIIEAHPDNINTVYGHLKVNPDFKGDIDYEEYEVIYLAIRVTDRNQEVNPDSADGTITIRVDDINDNAPQFIQDTLLANRSVIEEAREDTLIGSILAHDIDGPGNNIISYYIRPKVNASPPTPDKWISIDVNTGAIKVEENAIIDCDRPKLYYLEYTVTVSDGELSTEGDIRISIIDINNKSPYILEFKNPVELYENATTDTPVGYIRAADIDRDPPHNTLEYMINYPQFPDLRKFFEINVTSGLIQVKLQSDSVLDRDNGITQHEIHVNIEDNYQGNGRTNQNTTSLTLILLDVNDNAPELPDPKDFLPVAKEDTKKGTLIGPKLIATDRDEVNTPNSWISYRVILIVPAEPDEGIDSELNYEDLFTIQGDDKVYGQLVANKFLKGFHGIWMVTVEAFDHGDEGPSHISLKSRETYNITIVPDNFNAPTIIYPTNKDIIRLRYEGQEIGRPLLLTDMTALPLFEAYDPDGGIYGNITFEISSYNPQSGDADYFDIYKESTKKSRLQLRKQIKPTFYHLNVKAVDGGFKYSEEVTNLTLVFVDMQGDPYFPVTNFTTDFTENEFGLSEQRKIPNAFDPKNQGDENETYIIYYFIDPNYNPDDAKLFSLNKTTRVLMLQEMLDREEIDTHYIRIIASNRKDNPEPYPKENSMLILKITVNDVNDNPPEFEERSYSAGITSSDYINKPILTVLATDKDLNDSITYMFDPDSVSSNGENIDDIKRRMFTLDSETGVISLAAVPRANMKGYFQFNIIALDEVKHSDVCNVQIYIVSEINRVSFIFLASYQTVANNIQFLIKTFEEYYGYEKCNIDDYSDVSYGSDLTRSRDSGITNVRAHFIHNGEAIEASEIRAKSNDLNFIAKLKNALNEKSLILEDVPSERNDEVVENGEALTTVLIVVAVALTILCAILVVAFVMKTRALNRQMKAFSAPNFGSTSSNLNRREAPTTNVFSVEGSNPVLNNNELPKDAFDTMSVESYESDFVGINDDPTFNMSQKPRESKNIVLGSEFNAYRSPKMKRNGNIQDFEVNEKDEEGEYDENYDERY